tara:strand:- start:629 stop:934 length:306 start_codon:yes stop_codon:yes gene_type:complete
MNYQEIINRLKESFGITTDSDLAKILGVKRQDFHNQKKRNSIPFEKILISCNEENIDMEYIFFGQPCNNRLEISKLQDELRIEKRLVSEIKDMMKEIVGKT